MNGAGQPTRCPAAGQQASSLKGKREKSSDSGAAPALRCRRGRPARRRGGCPIQKRGETMRPDHPVQLAARTASVWMKIFAAIVGFVAAYLWYRSATSAGTG